MYSSRGLDNVCHSFCLDGSGVAGLRLMPASVCLLCCNCRVMVAEQAPALDEAGFHCNLLLLNCNPYTHIPLPALQAAHGGPQLHKPPPSSPWPPSLQRTPASPGRGSVSQAAAAVIAAPTAGAPARAAQAGAAGAEAAAAATEALQAEVRLSRSPLSHAGACPV